MTKPVRHLVRGRIQPPPLANRLVARPRIVEDVRRLIEDYRTMMVCASAGSGKTTAVLQGVRGTGRPLAWLTVDETDADTGHLLLYLEATLTAVAPQVADVAASALSAGIPHSEVAALLAESIEDVPLVLVIDDADHLVSAPQALALLGSFAHYMPPQSRLVVIGRRDIAIGFGSETIGALAGLGEKDLAFTETEVEVALDLFGVVDVDAPTAFHATGGWVAGVLFEAWRSADHVPGMGGEADPLHGYLASHVLKDLAVDEYEFLISTSVLDQVTEQAATAIGAQDARSLLARLRRRHLPVSWDTAETALRYHPRFREYLLELLGRRPYAAIRDLRKRNGGLLVSTGNYEEALREFLAADAMEEAVSAAQHCLEGVVDRGDIRLATEWLDALGPARHDRSMLAGAELMLAVAAENYRAAAALGDELRVSGGLEDFVRSSSRAGALLSWSYMHIGDVATARELLTITPAGPPREAMEYCLSLLADHPPDLPPPHLAAQSLDALIMRCHYYRGDFRLTEDAALSGWASHVGHSWRIGALLDSGHVDEAVRLLHAAEEAGERGAWFSGVLRVRVLIGLGDEDAARDALRSGRSRIHETGSTMLELFSNLAEAELELRLSNDVEAALSALALVLASPVIDDYAFIRDQALVLLGQTELMRGLTSEAAGHLRSVIETSVRANRLLVLPAAGVYLAEAEWRSGNADGADHAADVALGAAHRQGSDHLLLDALRNFPAVLSRRLDAEASPDSEWHAVARALLVQPGDGAKVGGSNGPHLTEFGELALDVAGHRVKPRIRKSLELLSFLAAKGIGINATRAELVTALFDGRSDKSTAAYLRQAVHHLREVLPPDTLRTDPGGIVGLRPTAGAISDSVRFRSLVAEAQTLRDEARLEGLVTALQLPSKGEFLPGVDTQWAEQQRSELQALVSATRFEAAETAYHLGRLSEARHLASQSLEHDPYREGAWRLVMRLADALGDEKGVMDAYRGCVRALNEIDADPADTTRQLLKQLRR